MKNNFMHIILLLGVSLSGHSQLVFNNVYDNDLKNDVIAGLIETDSYFITGGATNYGPGLSANSLVLVTDKMGDLIEKLDFHVGNGTDNYASDFLIKNDFLYILGSYIDTKENVNVGYNSFLYKVDQNFDSILLATIDLGYFDRSVDFVEYKEGFLLLGYVYDNVGLDSSKISLCYIDTFGNIINTKFFGSSGYDFAYDFKETSDGGFILAGETDDFPINSLNQLFLLKLDSNLNEEWYSEYGDLNINESIRSYNYLEQTDDEGYLMGAEYYTGAPEFTYNGLLLKFSNTGTLEWQDTLDYGDATNVKSIKVWKDESIIVLGGMDSLLNPQFPFGPPRGYIAKYTPDGQEVIWQRYLSKWWGSPTNDDYVHDMILTQDGGILVSGYQIHSLPSKNDGWLVKFDSCGFTADNSTEALLVIDSIIGYTVYISNLSQEYCNGGYVIKESAGNLLDSMSIYAYSEWTTGSNPHQMQYTFSDTGVFEISLSVVGGDVTDTYSLQINIQDTVSGMSHANLINEIILVYPNPAKGYFVIQSDFKQLNIQDEVLSCNVYNVTGSLIKRYDLDHRLYQQRLDLDNLVNGVYLLNFSIKGRSIGNKRLSVVR
ncbi:MAG: hypothetical protein ACI9O4_001939 [Chitinophagales bacterium]|jgi:hypothetical protein